MARQRVKLALDPSFVGNLSMHVLLYALTGYR
jgi:hypothetical protein